MRALVQRVRRAAVRAVEPDPGAAGALGAGREHLLGEIGPGLVVLVGVAADDGIETAAALAARVAHLRIFDDRTGRLNRSLLDVGGEALSVSQFTLYADTSGGRRPSFVRAARPEVAEPLYRAFNGSLGACGVRVVEGRFRARMLVEIHNDGPVTVLLDSADG
jgi:D-tyrosyl-tRNA(Tyr) deacylase